MADLSFLGRGWAFPPSLDPHANRFTYAEGEDDIHQSLRVLFATTPGERIMQPTYGCDVRRFLFQPSDLTTQTELKNTLARAILLWEPRITVNSLDVTTVGQTERIDVTIDYTVRATNSRNNRVFPLYLQEGTLLDTPASAAS